MFKVDNEHTEVLEIGALEGSPPVTLGSTALISFITDPDSDWIEISQRKLLTGDLFITLKLYKQSIGVCYERYN